MLLSNPIIVFFIVGAILSLTDLFFKRLPNAIVLPSIAYGIYLTGNWHWALLMFAVGALSYSKNRIAGGDVKLLALFGSFLGPWAVLSWLVSLILVAAYRTIRNCFGTLPYAPFLFISSLIFI
jgi:Flp pilus assembly protein protease CpaA